MMSSRIISNATTAFLVLCAAVVTTSIVRREFFATPVMAGAKPTRAPTKVREWRAIASQGTMRGSENASVTVTEFSDFQCPYCRRLSAARKELERLYGPSIRFSYRHFPIDKIHPHARAAAHLAECAGRVGKFWEVHDFLYAHQDSIGKLSWETIATRVAVPDADSIMGCMGDSTIAARVRADEATAARLGIKGTPVILVNEWMFAGLPPLTQLDSVVRSLLKR